MSETGEMTLLLVLCCCFDFSVHLGLLLFAFWDGTTVTAISSTHQCFPSFCVNRSICVFDVSCLIFPVRAHLSALESLKVSCLSTGNSCLWNECIGTQAKSYFCKLQCILDLGLCSCARAQITQTFGLQPVLCLHLFFFMLWWRIFNFLSNLIS